MNSSAPSPSRVLKVFDRLASPGTPLTTPEVAAEFDCTTRTIYNKLDALVDDGILETKKVGARGRVWWRPLYEHDLEYDGGAEQQADDQLREREEELAAELTDTRQVHEISTRLIQEDDIDALYEEILDAVVTIMDADFARLQLHDSDRGDLRLLADSGFDETTPLWERVTPESNGPCSVAVEAGQRVVVSDVETCEFMAGTEERETLLETGIRAVQSTPLVSRSGDVIGILSTHWETPHEPSECDLQHLDVLARQAADLIKNHQAEEALRESKEELATKLADTRQVQEISTRLIQEDDIDALYEEILDAVVTVLDSDFASFQLLDPDRNELRLLSQRGFDEAVTYWQRVDSESSSSCGVALDTGQRVVVSDVETCEFMAGTEDRETYLQCGVRAVQSTPLVSRSGDVVGMLSAHWETPHEPSERDLRLLDVLARQAADLIKHRQTEEALRESEERYRELFESMDEGFCVIEKADIGPEEPIDFRYVEANPAFAEQSGIDDVVGKTIRDVVPEEAQEWIDIYDTVVQTGEAKRFERELASQERILELHAFQVGDGASQRVGVVFRDITDRKQRTRALENAHNQLQAATSAGSIGLWTWNIQEDTLTVDDYVANCLDRDSENPISDAPLEGFFEQVHEDDRERVSREIERAIEETGKFDTEYRVRNADGDMMWLVDRAEIDYDENGEALRMYGAISDITERKRTEEKLRENEERYRTLFESVPVGVFVCDDSAVIQNYNRRAADLWGREPQPGDPDERYCGSQTLYLPDGTRLPYEQSPMVEVLEDGNPILDVEVSMERADGSRIPIIANFSPLKDENKETVGVITTFNDISERKQAEEALERANDGLERLNAASRELMKAETEGIEDRVAEITQRVLDVEYASLWCYDGTTGDIRRYASHTDSETDGEAIRYPDDFAKRVWQAFVGDETDLSHDLAAPEKGVAASSPLRSSVLVPLGRHGVVYAGSTRTAAFDEQTVDLAETVAATIETAWGRAEGERELADQNEELQRLDRLNSLIRTIDKALVEAETLEEIYETVCERLAESPLYEFAWIGDRDPITDAITPRSWAGVDSGYVDDLTVTLDEASTSEDPITSAARTGELQVVGDVATDARFAPWREATLERGARSCLSVPLVYEESLYGVLSVYADHPQSDERDHAVLAELGHTIGHAINAVETRETLHTDRVVELTLRCREPNTPLCRLARRTGCTIEFEGLVHQLNGEPDVFFTARGVSSEELQAAVEGSVVVEELLQLTEREDESLFRMRASDPTLAARCVEQEAVVHFLTIEDGIATAVVDLPHTANVRTFIERLQRTGPGVDVELRARRTRERPLKTRRTFRTACEDRLTPKQQTALQTAYLSGFFESPRVRTGEEVATSLDISQPTFANHLRAAQRGICEILFEER